MGFLKIQTLLATSSFSVLFVLMLFYFIDSSFKSLTRFHFLARFGLMLANLLISFLLILRWLEGKHFPLSNLYESLIFLSWSFTLIHLILEKITSSQIIGVLLSPISLFTNAFANFSLPSEMQKQSALVPALQSNWLMMHVTIMMLSYAALLTGSLFAFSFLILTLRETRGTMVTKQSNDLIRGETGLDLSHLKRVVNYDLLLQLPDSKNSLLEPINDYSKEALNLDNLSYRTLGLGFLLLTCGILSGAVWANEAWGSYWSWDPKETWAFITWLVYAIYLHTRITKKWLGKKPALIASIGFLVVWVCYLGVNLLSQGLHSYGWVQSTLNNF